jgi:oxygen-independent coproporphyrinogen-3 oxidase
MSEGPLGIYLHVPFCRTRCRYCDFYRVGANAERIAAYLEALDSEIRDWPGPTKPEVDSIFFGGGTPSLLDPGQIADLLMRLRARFDVLPGAEISLEANPSDLDRARLEGYREAGIDRLSLGAQSFVDRELTLLGRRHDADDVDRTFDLARAAGFDNVSLDLMLAVPGQTTAGLHRSVERAIDLDPEHLSLYLLEVHERSEMDFLRRSRPRLFPGEEAQRSRYLWTSERLQAAGYEHYEISNFSRPGRACRHNLKYWTCRETLGFGPAAHSLFGGHRWRQRPDLDGYIARPGRLEPVPCDLEEERLFLGLRLDRGVELSRLAAWLKGGESVVEERLQRLERFVERRDDRLRLRAEGRVVSTAVIAELLEPPGRVGRTGSLSGAARSDRSRSAPRPAARRPAPSSEPGGGRPSPPRRAH